MTRRRLLWIGSYTPDSGIEGSAAGVQHVWLDTDSGRLFDAGLSAPSSGPSFVVRSVDDTMVYAVNELDEGRVTGFAVLDGAGLKQHATAATGGPAPCHLLAHPAGRHLVVANYGDGSVSVHPIGGDGAPAEPVQRLAHTGSGPNPDRQEGPHAHSVSLAPGGAHLLIADLGTDELRCHPFDPDADEPAGPGHVAARLAPGTGPRHLAVHSSGHLYVAGELDSRVHTLRFDPATARAEAVAATAATHAAEGDNFPAEIALSPDERRLYVANRGADTIATFAVSADGAHVHHLAETPTGGQWPRHFARVDGHLVVANQNSATLTTLALDSDGVPEPVRHTHAVPTPVCVRPAALG